MSGGDRRFILAVGLGLVSVWSAFIGAYGAAVLGGWQPQKSSDQSYYAEGPDGSDTSTLNTFATYGDLEKSACYSAKNHDTADLCAQWRAALAAEKAASAARDAVTWTIISTLLNSIGLGALIVTIAQGRKALKRARQANKIARDTAARQLRAYVSIEPCGVNAPENGLVRVPVRLKNWGQTPAHNVMIFSGFAMVRDPFNFDKSTVGAPLAAAASDIVYAPGEHSHAYPYVEADFFSGHWDDLENKRVAFVHFGYVTYLDAFKVRRETNFAMYHWGDELSDEESKRCRLGNTAT